jgi:hypothetical protein
MGSYIQLLECANIHTGPELQILETDLTSDCHPCLRYCYNSLQVSLADQSIQNMARRMQPTSRFWIKTLDINTRRQDEQCTPLLMLTTKIKLKSHPR